jgi:hypothetical protein
MWNIDVLLGEIGRFVLNIGSRLESKKGANCDNKIDNFFKEIKNKKSVKLRKELSANFSIFVKIVDYI